MDGRIYSPAETKDPVQRRRQSGADLINQMHTMIVNSVGPLGVFPQHILWRRTGSEDAVYERVWAPGGLVVAQALKLLYGGHGIGQIIFGVDVQEAKPKNLTYGTGVIVALWDQSWRIGVIQYRTDPRLIKPIDWNHQSSIAYMQHLIKLYDWKNRIGRSTEPFVLN